MLEQEPASMQMSPKIVRPFRVDPVEFLDRFATRYETWVPLLVSLILEARLNPARKIIQTHHKPGSLRSSIELVRTQAGARTCLHATNQMSAAS